MHADRLDPYRFERAGDNLGVSVPVPLRIRHEGNLAHLAKRLSQDPQCVLQIPTTARRVTIRKQNQTHATQCPSLSDQLVRSVFLRPSPRPSAHAGYGGSTHAAPACADVMSACNWYGK